jgi:hypothetical protein
VDGTKTIRTTLFHLEAEFRQSVTNFGRRGATDNLQNRIRRIGGVVAVVEIDGTQLRDQLLLGIVAGHRPKRRDSGKMVVSVWALLPRLACYRGILFAVDDPNGLIERERRKPVAEMRVNHNSYQKRRCPW